MRLHVGDLLRSTESFEDVVRTWGDGSTWWIVFDDAGWFNANTPYRVASVPRMGDIEIERYRMSGQNRVFVSRDVARDMRREYLSKKDKRA